MFRHSGYGLTIHSEMPLPELRAGGEEPDVVIRYGQVPGPPGSISRDAKRWLGGTFYDLTIWWHFLGQIRIRGGSDVTVELAPGVSQDTLRGVLMGSVMGVLLLQRTPSVFHSSVVAAAGGAIAFMASKGHGKSTTASALRARGFDILSDDLLVLDDACRVRRGFQTVRLWPDSLQALGYRPDDFSRVVPALEKRAQPLENGLDDCLPLQGVYVLAFGREMQFKRLKQREAFFAVMRHWYGAQFQGDLLPLVNAADQLAEVRRLVDRVPVYRLTRPVDLNALDHLSSCLEMHIECLTQPRIVDQRTP